MNFRFFNCFGALLAYAAFQPAIGQELDFNRDIKPILSENCYFCHGPDGKNRKAKLRLDTYDGAIHEVVVPGKPAESELIARIFSSDPDAQMPPPEAKIALDERQKDLLERWVAAGAEYDEHWSFVPPEKVELREGEHPLDQLVGSEPAPEAERALLLRRVFLDLTGLPPTPQELARFVSDEEPGAYERLVGRLLASPAYGERMAWDWLDAARYADSNGYQGDNERTMWPWRDWVVDAFNANMPYDQFTIWQLAGDLIPDATDMSRMATGFLRNHPINGEGGRIPEENRVDYVMDMTETMGTVWLGLTLNCCRCHDHKFDPLLQKDYYQFTDFFNQTPVTGGGGNAQTPPVLAVLNDREKSEIAKIGEKIAALDQDILDHRREPTAAKKWQPLIPATATAAHQSLAIEKGGEVLAHGDSSDNDTYTIVSKTRFGKVAALRLEALKHESMTAGGLSRADSANFVLSEIEISIRRGWGDLERVKIARSKASFEQGSWAVAGTYDGKVSTGWAVLDGKFADREQTAVWYFEKPVSLGAEDQLEVVLRHDSKHKLHNMGHFRLSLSDDGAVGLAEAEDAKLVELKGQREKLVKRRVAVQRRVPNVMVMADMDTRRKTFILGSGLYSERQDEVGPGIPEALPQMPDSFPDNRLGLARWIVSPENPLTARVTVNRLWQQLFGIGLVKTPEDFGSQGELPPNQELLDWMAVDFVENGWDVKRLMRLIVTSKIYKQTAKSAEGYLEDPQNRQLARGPRFRMPGWMLRDQALSVSGLLVEKRGGKPLNPYQPPGIWEEMSFGKKKYVQDSGESLYRRGIYTFWRRIAPPTAFFDNSGRQLCQVNPLRTNTPLQALYTLNDVVFVEAARVLAEKAMLAHPESDAGRFNFIFYRVLARRPSLSEVATLNEIRERTESEYTASIPDAKAFLSLGESPRNEDLGIAEHASWTALALAVLNLDEAVTKP